MMIPAKTRKQFPAGARTALPPGYKGYVIEKSTQLKEDGTAPTVWKASSTLLDITYWNHDKAASSTDAFQRALEWLAVAHQVRRMQYRSSEWSRSALSCSQPVACASAADSRASVRGRGASRAGGRCPQADDVVHARARFRSFSSGASSSSRLPPMGSAFGPAVLEQQV